MKTIARTLLSAVLVPFAFSSAGAQPPPTNPPTINFTCHGYLEGETRAYNCIPAAEQQPLMRTFVPPVGAQCTTGRVDEFPPGRVVFQIRCFEEPNRGPGVVGGGGGKQLWSRSGKGNAVLDKPAHVLRLRLHATYAGVSDHVAVFCVDPSDVLVAVVPIGTYWGFTSFDQVIIMPLCTRMTVETDPAVSWRLNEELGGTAASLQRNWEQVAGDSSWPTKVLEDLAEVTDLLRRYRSGASTVEAFEPPSAR